MKKLGFFIGAVIVTASIECRAQSNSLGDRAPEKVKESKEQKKAPKQRVSKRQRLLFRKPNVRNTAEYEYYEHVEKIAREKARIALKKKQLIKIPHVSYTAEYDFYKRVELAARRRQRLLRKGAEPQYSNFAYFGHKRPPKRHLPYEMRYCKECGIRH
jgi:hypothetical protein